MLPATVQGCASLRPGRRGARLRLRISLRLARALWRYMDEPRPRCRRHVAHRYRDRRCGPVAAPSAGYRVRDRLYRGIGAGAADLWLRRRIHCPPYHGAKTDPLGRHAYFLRTVARLTSRRDRDHRRWRLSDDPFTGLRASAPDHRTSDRRGIWAERL